MAGEREKVYQIMSFITTEETTEGNARKSRKGL